MGDTGGRSRRGGVDARRGVVAACAAAALAIASPAPASGDPARAPSPARQVDALLKARALDEWGDRAGALRILDARVHAAPADVDARAAYGLMLVSEGRLEDARAELEAARAIAPDRADVLRGLLDVELRSGRAARDLATATSLGAGASIAGAAPAVLACLARALDLAVALAYHALFSEPPPAPKPDLLASARSLSQRGDRAGALTLLSWHLEARPTDTDARTLYGTMLSWEGRYDDAREQLARVLKEVPGHGDAARAALKVELWSDHPDRAEALANAALARAPDHADLLLDRARARFAKNDLDGARADLDRVLALEPDDADAARLKRRVLAAGRVWGIGGSYELDAFSDGRSPWHELTLQAKRLTPLGTVFLRGYEAWRWDTNDNQIEIEAYPSLWKGAYGDLAGAVSPNAVLYPKYRVQIDVYQSLPFGFEVSLGYRHMQFARGVNMGVASIGKYLGDWLFTLRSFVTPGVDGTSVSIFGSVRYYFSEAVYVGGRAGYGLSQEEIRSVDDTALLGSATIGAEAFGVLFDRLELGARGAVSREARADQPALWQFGFSTSVGFLF